MPRTAILFVPAFPVVTWPLVMRSRMLFVPVMWALVMGWLLAMMNLTVMALVVMPFNMGGVVWVVVLIVVLVMTFNVMIEGRREPEMETRMPISAGGKAHQAKSNHDRGSADEERVAHGILRRRRSIPAILFQWPVTASSTPR